MRKENIQKPATISYDPIKQHIKLKPVEVVIGKKYHFANKIAWLK
jgi:hypothetical protein